MPTRILPKRFDLAAFSELIITENRNTTSLNLRLTAAEEKEIDRLTEEKFRTHYEAEYLRACEEAEDRWYPYRAASILDEQLIDYQESHDVQDILKNRWWALRKEIQSTYLNETIVPELERAVNRRAILEPKLETDWGFRVKSRGEQLIANALRFYTFTNKESGQCRRITLFYEPLFRIPKENRVVIPDFVIQEYGAIIEYAGVNERNYKIGLLMKIDAFRQLGIPVVILRPEDLTTLEISLKQKLSFYFTFDEQESSPF